MNYHRRTTRPDANYYRETRKTARLSRSRRGGISPIVIFLFIVALAVTAFFLFRR
jgi:hypothetical protein